MGSEQIPLQDYNTETSKVVQIATEPPNPQRRGPKSDTRGPVLLGGAARFDTV